MTISVAALTARVAAMVLFCAAGWPSRIWAAVPVDSGVPEFRAVTTNLDGRGISVAQPEASLTMNLLTWEVNPASSGRASSLVTYNTFDGTTNEFPNALGFESGHADAVGDIFYGTADGIAPGVARVDNFEADFFYENFLCNTNLPGIGDTVINQSFTFGTLALADQENGGFRNTTIMRCRTKPCSFPPPTILATLRWCAPPVRRTTASAWGRMPTAPMRIAPVRPATMADANRI